MTKKSENEREAYNGLPVKEGEVLVPMIVDDNFIRVNDVSKDKLRTWGISGVSYQVAFYPIPKENVDIAMKEYRWNLNQLLDDVLGSNRGSRCLIPQPDGSLQVCPKKRGNNRPACKDCPNRYLFEKEDNSTISIDKMGDDHDLLPAAPDDTEKEALLPMEIEELLSEVREEDYRTYRILLLLTEDMKKSDIIKKIEEEFDLGMSRAYDVFDDAVSIIRNYFDL